MSFTQLMPHVTSWGARAITPSAFDVASFSTSYQLNNAFVASGSALASASDMPSFVEQLLLLFTALSAYDGSVWSLVRLMFQIHPVWTCLAVLSAGLLLIVFLYMFGKACVANLAVMANEYAAFVFARAHEVVVLVLVLSVFWFFAEFQKPTFAHDYPNGAAFVRFLGQSCGGVILCVRRVCGAVGSVFRVAGPEPPAREDTAVQDASGRPRTAAASGGATERPLHTPGGGNTSAPGYAPATIHRDSTGNTGESTCGAKFTLVGRLVWLAVAAGACVAFVNAVASDLDFLLHLARSWHVVSAELLQYIQDSRDLNLLSHAAALLGCACAFEYPSMRRCVVLFLVLAAVSTTLVVSFTRGYERDPVCFGPQHYDALVAVENWRVRDSVAYKSLGANQKPVYDDQPGSWTVSITDVSWTIITVLVPGFSKALPEPVVTSQPWAQVEPIQEERFLGLCYSSPADGLHMQKLYQAMGNASEDQTPPQHLYNMHLLRQSTHDSCFQAVCAVIAACVGFYHTWNILSVRSYDRYPLRLDSSAPSAPSARTEQHAGMSGTSPTESAFDEKSGKPTAGTAGNSNPSVLPKAVFSYLEQDLNAALRNNASGMSLAQLTADNAKIDKFMRDVAVNLPSFLRNPSRFSEDPKWPTEVEFMDCFNRSAVVLPFAGACFIRNVLVVVVEACKRANPPATGTEFAYIRFFLTRVR
jgi:hypothetical protein